MPNVQAPEMPFQFRGLNVTREHFITSQHFDAWKRGRPHRRHIDGRKKLSREEKDHLYAHLGYKCVVCGRTDYLTLDHKVPVALGGSSNPCNFRVMCQRDNTSAFTVFRRYLKEYDAWLASEEAA